MKKSWCILLTIVNLLLLVFLLWVLDEKPNTHINGNNITTLLGLMVSSVSIVITMIFVVLAINAYGRIKEIEKHAEIAKTNADNSKESAKMAKTDLEKADRMVEDINNSHDTVIIYMQHIGVVTKSCFERIWRFIETVDHSDPNQNQHDKEWRKDVEKQLYRLGLYPYFLDDDTREKYLRDLSALADKSDIESLERIIKSENESEKIKRVAGTVLEDLKKKYP